MTQLVLVVGMEEGIAEEAASLRIHDYLAEFERKGVLTPVVFTSYSGKLGNVLIPWGRTYPVFSGSNDLIQQIRTTGSMCTLDEYLRVNSVTEVLIAGIEQGLDSFDPTSYTVTILRDLIQSEE